MSIHNKLINMYNGKKIATKLKKSNLTPIERNDLLTKLEKIGAGYESILHHSDIKFDIYQNRRYSNCDESIDFFCSSLYFMISKEDILPTGAIIVGVRKVLIREETKDYEPRKYLRLFDDDVLPHVDALVAYTPKKGAPFRECISTSVNYYTQNKCTLSQALGAKVINHSEINAENYNFEVGDAYETAYVRFTNAYYRAMRLLNIVELHKNEPLSISEKNQLKSIYSSARIIFNRALFDLISAHGGFDTMQAEKMRREIVADSKSLKLKAHINKWKNEMVTINAPRMIRYINKDSLERALKNER